MTQPLQGGDSALTRLRTEVWRTPSPGPFPGPVPSSAEVTVVGGGVIGLACALALAQEGADVVLLERACLGCGASGRNAGLYLRSMSPLEHIDHLTGFLGSCDIDLGYRKSGHLALALDADSERAFVEEAARRTERPAVIEVLPPAEAARRGGFRPGAQVRSGRWYRDGAMLNPWRFLAALAHAATRAGVRIVEQAQVRQIAVTAAQVTLNGNNWTHRAPICLLASGSWTGALLPQNTLGLASRLRPAQMIALPVVTEGPGMATGFGQTYWRGHEGWTLAGGHGDLDRATVAAGDHAVAPKVQAAIARTLAKADQRLAGHVASFGWAGVLDITPDSRPILGPVDPAARLWVACGFGGHGLPPALGIGKALAASLSHGAPVPAAVSIDRFEAVERRQG